MSQEDIVELYSGAPNENFENYSNVEEGWSSEIRSVTSVGFDIKAVDAKFVVCAVHSWSSGFGRVKEGDVIISIDERMLGPNLDLLAICHALEGFPGSVVTVGIRGNDTEEKIEMFRHSCELQSAVLPFSGLCVQRGASGQFIISKILKDSPAAWNGSVALGDTIESVDGRKFSNMRDLCRSCIGLEGSLLHLDIRDNSHGVVRTVNLMRHRQVQDCEGYDGMVMVEISADEHPVGIGLHVKWLIPGAVMVVCAIEEGSPSYWSGIEEGDVIIDVDTVVVLSPSHFNQMTSGRSGTRVMVGLASIKDLPDRRTSDDMFSRRTDYSGIVDKGTRKNVALVRSATLTGDALVRAFEYRSQVVRRLEERLQKFGLQRFVFESGVSRNLSRASIMTILDEVSKLDHSGHQPHSKMRE